MPDRGEIDRNLHVPQINLTFFIYCLLNFPAHAHPSVSTKHLKINKL